MNSSYTVIFFSLIIVTSVMSIIYFTNFNTFFSHWKTHLYDKEENKFVISSPVLYNSSMKYILMWTLNTTVPFVYLKSGNEIFVSEECEYQNCYITNNRKYFSDIKKFDALIFHAPEYTWINNHRHLGFPSERGYHQKYVFTCFESSDNYPACDRKFNNYFNWTWTYRTDGDVKWGYIDIKDMNDNIVGPKPNMQWIKNMTDISSEQKEMLKSKTKAAAWFVSNCYTSSRREKFASELHKSLIIRGFTLDIYGKCGKLSCPRDDESKCFELLKKDYFFYLSFENSFCEDYVTEKLIHALKNWVIPVVWGGADYTRFMPPGAYLNAREFKNADELAERMIEIMGNIEEYSTFFRWRNYYKYQRDIETPDTRASCRMCKALNDPVMMSEHKSYENFIKWWNGDKVNYCKS